MSPLFAAETTIKGDQMELLNKGDTVIFRGHVKMERGGDILTAHEMTTNRERDKVKAKGNVELFRQVSDTETWKGYGASGTYDTTQGSGYLRGRSQRARFIQTTLVYSTTTKKMMERKLDIVARRFYFSETGPAATALDKVYGTTTDPETGDNYEFWSDRADYEGGDKKIVLTGKRQPRVRSATVKDVKTIRGKKIIYYLEGRRIVSEGDAMAVMVDMAGRTIKK